MDYLKQQNWSKHKIAYYGHTRSWSQRGAAVSSLIAGFIILLQGNYRDIFLLSTIPYVLNMLLILSYPKILDHGNNGQDKLTIQETFSSFFTVMKNWRLITLISHAALHSAYLKAVKDYIQPLMLQVAITIPLVFSMDRDQQNGLSIGIFYFVIYLLTSFASRSASHIEQHNRKHIVVMTLLLGFSAGIISGIFYQLHWSILALLTFTMIYIIENIRKPILTGYVADEVPGEILSSVLSAQSLIKTLMTAFIALVFGVFADVLGIAWALCIVSTLLSILLLVIAFISSLVKKS